MDEPADDNDSLPRRCASEISTLGLAIVSVSPIVSAPLHFRFSIDVRLYVQGRP